MIRTHESLFGEVFPGLLERLEAFPGQWIGPYLYETPQHRCYENGALCLAAMAARRTITGLKTKKSVVVQIAIRTKHSLTGWNPEFVSFHCGPDPTAMDEVHFRIDANRQEGPHCHVFGYGPKPEKGGHHRFSRVRPTPTLDPNDFMTHVEHFIKTGEVPFEVRP